MKSLFYSLSILLISFVSVAQELALPTASQELADRLNEWEAEQKAALEKRINDKRDQVIQVFSTQLENATKEGDLDGALAIRNYIESLQNASEGSAPEILKLSTPETQMSAEVAPPRDSLRLRNSYVKVFSQDEPITRTEAAAKCQEMGGNLISLESEEKWLELREYLRKNDAPSQIWVGANRSDENSPFAWPNGEAMDYHRVLKNSEQDERLKKGDYRFISVSPDGYWAYKQDGDPLVKGYICEWDR